MDQNTFNATFWITMSGIISALVIALIKSINKSKCSNFKCCWGMVDCLRNTDVEAQIENHRIELNIPDTPTSRD